MSMIQSLGFADFFSEVSSHGDVVHFDPHQAGHACMLADACKSLTTSREVSMPTHNPEDQQSDAEHSKSVHLWKPRLLTTPP